jgi:hypothetical protein
VVFSVSLVGCSTSDAHRCTGPTGFASDRAREIALHLEGDVSAPTSDDDSSVAARAGSQALADLQAHGADVAPEHATIEARVRASTPLEYGRKTVSYAADVTTFVRGARPTPGEPASALLAATPPWGELGDESTLRIGAVFGQMTDGVLTDADPGMWSAMALDDALTQRGFTREGRVHRKGRIVVEVLAPELAPIFDDVTRERTSRIVSESDVVYVNGHANTHIMDAMSLPDSWAPRKPRLVVLDSCWSYFLESSRVQAMSGDTHLIVTDGRAVTGSVESFFPLLDALIAPESAPTWRSLLVPMNDRAEARAIARKGKVVADFEPPEVYGVVPPRAR